MSTLTSLRVRIARTCELLAQAQAWGDRLMATEHWRQLHFLLVLRRRQL